MSGTIKATDLLEHIHIDPEIALAGLYQSGYCDLKTLLQLCQMVDAELDRRKEHLKEIQKSSPFAAYAQRLYLFKFKDKERHFLDLDAPDSDRAAAHYAAERRRDRSIKELDNAIKSLWFIKEDIKNNKVMNGMDELRKIYSQDPILFALMQTVASAQTEKEKKGEVGESTLAPPR
jgi:hypothetical protein